MRPFGPETCRPGVVLGRGRLGVGEGVTGSALSIGTPPSVGAVPVPEIWALENVSTKESSFDTSA